MLSAGSRAVTIADGSGLGTILNDDFWDFGEVSDGASDMEMTMDMLDTFTGPGQIIANVFQHVRSGLILHVCSSGAWRGRNQRNQRRRAETLIKAGIDKAGHT